MRFRAALLIAFAVSSILLGPVRATVSQEVNRSTEPRLETVVDAETSLVRQGIRAMDEGRFEEAEEHFKNLARKSPDGHYHLARLYLTPGFVDARSAFVHLGEARDQDPDNPGYLRERLRQLRSGLPFFTGGMDRSGERNTIAKRLLEIHGNDAIALEEIATTAAWDYFWFERRFGARAGPRMRSRIDAFLEEAIEHFDRAIDVNPTRTETYREYLRVLIRSGSFDKADSVSVLMTTRITDEPESWLLRGMIVHMDGSPERAWQQFRRGLSLMTPHERDNFNAWHLLVRRDLRDSLVAAGPAAEESFWRVRDTRRMTSVNERLVSHYGRLVYSDLFYPKWREFIDDDWLITPGDVIVRYGYPVRDWSLPRSGEGPEPANQIVLAFADDSFTFQDWTGNGEFLIPTRRSQDDPTTLARSAFAETPERAEPIGKEEFEVPYIVSRFPKPDGETDVVVSFGVPVWTEDDTRDIEIQTRSGVFIVDDEGYDGDRFVQTSPRMRVEDLTRADTLLLWTNSTTLGTAQGSYRLQLEVESDDMVASHWEGLEIPSVHGDSLWLSDILPATLVQPVDAGSGAPGITRGQFRISPAAMNVFSRDVPLYLYFELGGLDASSGAARYETEIFIADEDDEGMLGAIGRLFTGDGARVAASFESSIETTEDQQYFILDLRYEKPGPHLIGLRITDMTTGESVESSRRIDIR